MILLHGLCWNPVIWVRNPFKGRYFKKYGEITKMDQAIRNLPILRNDVSGLPFLHLNIAFAPPPVTTRINILISVFCTKKIAPCHCRPRLLAKNSATKLDHYSLFVLYKTQQGGWTPLWFDANVNHMMVRYRLKCLLECYAPYKNQSIGKNILAHPL